MQTTVIDNQLCNIENIIVGDGNNIEQANKCQGINNNDVNINHGNEVHHESPNENNTSTNENNSTQGALHCHYHHQATLYMK